MTYPKLRFGLRLGLAALTVLGLAACSPKAAPEEASESPSAEMPGAAASSVAGIAANAVASSDNLLDCNTPVSRTATFKSLSATFKDNAQLGTIMGAEGADIKGLLLYDKIPSRKLEVIFWDDAMEHVSGVQPALKAVAWTGPEGIHIGSTLKYIEAANGKPVSLAGFGWDYGGYVTDFNGGKLDHLPGGCRLMLRFSEPDDGLNAPDGVSGDGVTLKSDDPRFKTWKPVVSEMGVGWPLPPGVKPSEN